MSNEMPDRVYINESDREDYRELLDEEDSPLYNIGNPAIFLLASVVGYYRSDRVELDSKDGWTRTEYFDEEDLSVMKAIAIQENGLDTLLDKEEVFAIAEQYATTGIKILKNEIYGGEYGSFLKRLESDLKKEYEKL